MSNQLKLKSDMEMAGCWLLLLGFVMAPIAIVATYIAWRLFA